MPTEPSTSRPRRTKTERPPAGERPPRASVPPDAPVEDSTPRRRSPEEKKLAEAISGSYQMVGAMMLGIGMRMGDNGLAGTAVKTMEMADPLSDAWIDLAQRNPAVKRALKRFTEASAASVLIGLHISLAVPLLADRGVIPESVAAMAGASMDSNGNGASN